MARNSSNNPENCSPNDEINSNHSLYLHQTDHPRLILILKKLTGSDKYSSWKKLKQDNSSVEIYYQKLKGLWDGFDALEAPYLCLCVCSCANGRISGERDQRKRLIQFLMGLDECYSNIIGKILLMQPLPTAAKAYTMVRQEKKQRKSIAPKSTSSTIPNSYSNRYIPQNNHSYPKHNVPNTPNLRFTPQIHAQTSLREKVTSGKGYIVEIVAKKVIYKKNVTKLLAILLVTHFMEKFNPQNNYRKQKQ
nr:UBN2_3 domain-containing protein [Tanacetum cinerariifolium]